MMGGVRWSTPTVEGRDVKGTAPAVASAEDDEIEVETILASVGWRFDHQAPVVHPLALFESDDRHGCTLRKHLEASLATIEKGSSAFAFSSNHELLLSLLSCFPKAHLIIPDSVFQGVATVLAAAHAQWGITAERVTMVHHAAVKERLEASKKEHAERTVLLWMDSPSNPKAKVMDVPKLSKLAKSILGEDKCVVIVDSTLATPYLLRPLALGADVVVHSNARFMAGQPAEGSMLVLGHSHIAKHITPYIRNYHSESDKGLNAFDSWLVLKGLETLSARMQAHSASAMAIAEYLSGHEGVLKVYYPGIITYAHQKLANELMAGRFGGIVSFTLKAADEAKAAKTAQTVSYLKLHAGFV